MRFAIVCPSSGGLRVAFQLCSNPLANPNLAWLMYLAMGGAVGIKPRGGLLTERLTCVRHPASAGLPFSLS